MLPARRLRLALREAEGAPRDAERYGHEGEDPGRPFPARGHAQVRLLFAPLRHCRRQSVACSFCVGCGGLKMETVRTSPWAGRLERERVHVRAVEVLHPLAQGQLGKLQRGPQCVGQERASGFPGRRGSMPPWPASPRRGAATRRARGPRSAAAARPARGAIMVVFELFVRDPYGVLAPAAVQIDHHTLHGRIDRIYFLMAWDCSAAAAARPARCRLASSTHHASVGA